MARPSKLAEYRARKGFENFTGRAPSKEWREKLDSDDVAAYALGSMVGVAYQATRDGQTDQYFHRFKKAARPTLAVRADGKQLYIAGGDYKVTDRGIEDMPELFIVNPSRRKSKAKASPKRRRASATKKGTTFMANPVRRRRRKTGAKRRAVTTYRRNPAPRRRRSRAVSVRRFRRNPVRRISAGKGKFAVMPMIIPAITIGAGAVGTELLMGYLPLPAALKKGPVRYATKAAVGVAAGYAIAKFFNRKAGEAFAMGALVIAAHDAIKNTLTSFMPGAQFGGWTAQGYDTLNARYNPDGLGYYTPGSAFNVEPTMGEYMPSNGMGEYTDVRF